METFNFFFACRNVLAANRHYPKKVKDFFACRIFLDADHQQPGNIQRLFRLQICLSRRSSIPRKHSKTFSPAEISQTQIINNLEIFKDFFTCRIVLAANDQQHGNIQTFSTCRILLAANHQQPGNSQRNFHRQKYVSQTINNMETFNFFFACRNVLAANRHYPKKVKDFFACRILLGADHQQPGNIQRLFRLQT